MSLDRIRSLLVDVQVRLRPVQHTNGARRALTEAIRELDGMRTPEDPAAIYQGELRRQSDRIRPERDGWAMKIDTGSLDFQLGVLLGTLLAVIGFAAGVWVFGWSVLG